MKMQTAIRLLLLSTFACSSASARAAEPAPRPAQTQPVEIETFIPPDGIVADVMTIKSSPRLTELTLRFQLAAAKDPEWFKSHVAKAKPGKPLDYDERLGLSREEYDEMLRLFDEMRFEKSGTTTSVHVTRAGDRVTLTFGDELMELPTATLDLKSETVTTRFGVASVRSAISANDGQKTIGPWNGVEWKQRTISEDESEQTFVNFALGRLKDERRGLVYVNIVQNQPDNHMQVTYLIEYDLPKPKR